LLHTSEKWKILNIFGKNRHSGRGPRTNLILMKLRQTASAAIIILATAILPSCTTSVTKAELPDAPAPIIEAQPQVSAIQTIDKIDGYNGGRFYITRPKAAALATAKSSDFGMDPSSSDNTAAFTQALNYLKENPGTKFIIEPGDYHFMQERTIELRDLKDIYIEGTGAKFITGRMGYFMGVYGCNCLEINGLSVDWERGSDPIDDVFRVKDADPANGVVEFEFFQRDTVSAAMRIQAITQCDPESYTFGAKGSSKEWYYYINPSALRSIENVSPNTLRFSHDGALSSFADGEIYILRHHVYDGTIFNLADGSRDITFSKLNIFGSPGMALIVGGGASHYQMLDCFVGVDPALANKHHVSLGADAVHIANSNGCFRVKGCDMSRQGDDAVNVHDGLGYISSVEGNVARMYAAAMQLNVGDTLSFKDKDFAETGFKAAIVAADLSGTLKTITFDRDISEYVAPDFTAWNIGVDSGNYVITDNYFHENRARGILLQSSRGICANNRFYKIQGQAIRIVMDIIPAYWQEGTGVDGLIVRNNTFDTCDYGNWGRQVEISTSIDGRSAGAPVFRNVEITDNVFTNSSSLLLDAANVEKMLFARNVIDSQDEQKAFRFGDHCRDNSVEGNIFK